LLAYYTTSYTYPTREYIPTLQSRQIEAMISLAENNFGVFLLLFFYLYF